MRHIAVASCILVVAGSIALLHAQQPVPSFKGGVSLATVDVTVLDKEGTPVPGLTAADFQMKLNGKVQPIRALSYAVSGDRRHAGRRAGAARYSRQSGVWSGRTTRVDRTHRRPVQ